MSTPLSNEQLSSTPPAEHTAHSTEKTGPTAQPNSKTRISSLEDLKHKAPKLYNQMMVSIAMNICNRMKRAQDRLKVLMRQASG